MDTPRTLYKITKNSPGSEAAGEAAAALAAAYLVFRDDRDKTYATQLLATSRSVRRVSSSPCMHDIHLDGFLLHDLVFRQILPYICIAKVTKFLHNRWRNSK